MTQPKPSTSAVKTIGRAILILLSMVLAACLLIQLIPVQRDNPSVVDEPKWDSPQTRELAKRACFDCHSDETVWPWYAYVAPMSWLVTSDVQEGRARLNFSEWSRRGRVHEIGEVISEGAMPPPYYLPMHPNAQLTDAEKQQLITGLQASLQ